MTSVAIKDANGATKYLDTTGTGTSGDPFKVVNDIPSGAATEAKQDTANGHLATLASGVNINASQGVDINSGQEIAIADDVTMLHVEGVTSGSGATQMIAAPGASTRIVVSCLKVQLEDSNTTLVKCRDGSTDELRHRLKADGDDHEWRFFPGREWKLSADTALNIYLDAYGAVAVGYSIAYYTEST